MEQKVNLYILMLLTLVGGFCDASAFITQGIFVGHITGNTVLTMVYLVQGNNVMADYCIISLFFFLFGTYIKNISGTRDRKANLYNSIIPTLLQQSALLITGAILWIANSHSLFILFLALSMGLQNGITTHLHKITIHTTYITGMSTALLKSLTGEISSDKCKLRKVLSSELISFSTGAFLGSVLTTSYHIIGFLAVLFPLLAAGILSFISNNYLHDE